MIRDLLLSIALWGGFTFYLAVQTQINEFAYEKIKGWFND